MKILLIVIGFIAALFLFVWIGMNVKPKPFSPFPQPEGEIKTVPLPEGLPAPVERFFRQVYGDVVPVIESAVITTRATLRPVPGFPAFPARFRFTHDAGQGYRHYIEMTLFGIPIVFGNEHYLDGKGRMDISLIGVEEGAYIDSAANLGLWAESVWLPSIWVTDPRLRWEPVDEESAILVVPFGEDEQHLLIRFNPDTGMVEFMEAMRYRDNPEQKVLWICQSLDWGSVNGYTLATKGTITWFDQGSPWAVFYVEDIVYNVAVDDYIRARGE